jgi:hypothetical protein
MGRHTTLIRNISRLSTLRFNISLIPRNRLQTFRDFSTRGYPFSSRVVYGKLSRIKATGITRLTHCWLLAVFNDPDFPHHVG